ncbi:ragulator complex protein LAMTOR1-like [Amphiura filiformis]|uniref:ragulator complex protein LAMTOR1-like n=1 Tax=Amphiura filiformis TaxID=82378 RepID=UPI003B221727
MGCCFGRDDDKNTQEQDANERTHLLRNPTDPVPSRPLTSDEFDDQRVNSLKKGDEQSELNRILHRAANNVIDVSAIESHTMEQHEYMDRARAYSSRVAVVVTGPKKTGAKSLPNGVAIPYSVLSSDPVSLTDINLITLASESAWKAVCNIKVDHKEDLVVQFPLV